MELPLGVEQKLPPGKVEVTDKNGKPLPVGKYTFSLIVEDDLGVPSAAAEVTVTVAAAPKITSILVSPDTQFISPNATFTLDARAEDPNGVPIKTFRWTRTK